MRCLHARRSVGPFFRQIKGPVDEGVTVARHIGRKHSDLTIRDLARRARVLACNPARRLALLRKAGFVYDENRILIAKGFQHVIAYNIAQGVGAPLTAAKDRLLTPGTRITGCFRAHPAGLARLVPQQTIQKLTSRCRHALLKKQRPNARLHVP